jgi:hypothetical protein
MATVDEQLDNLCDILHGSLSFQLVLGTNRDYWEEIDELCQRDIDDIDATIDFSFELVMLQYEKIPKVLEILENAQIMLKNVTWAAMNVPFPEDTDRHIQRVVNNVYHIFVHTYYPALRTEMIEANHQVQVIQRVWKNAISNPNFLACRRRLEREFKDMNGPLENSGYD